MCGIAAVISNVCKKEEREKWVSGMLKFMQHRGPDYSQFYSDDWVTIGHNRLSILDLSERAHQPLFSPDGRYCIVLNGEIYNYLQLRTELQRVSAGNSNATVWHFKTTSDTEVVLAAYVRWKEQCLQFLKGMFAFIIYDSAEKKLFVARDRFGVKPLYYYYSDEFLLISSEIRAIIRHIPFQWKLDASSLFLYFQYQTFFHDSTPVRQIKSLLPGHYFNFSNGKAERVNYYSFQLPEQFDGDENHAIQVMREKLFRAVERRMVSDVPVAAFLSGGIDSSVVVAAMRMVSENPIHTFHVTFREKPYSESDVAAIIARKYNTQHQVLVCSPEQIVKELDEFLDSVDIPGGDGLNTWVISRLVHQKGIRVTLSGIGGDEWALGYPVFTNMIKFLKNKNILKCLSRFPHIVLKWILNPGKSMQHSKLYDFVRYSSHTPFDFYRFSRRLFTEFVCAEYTHINEQVLPDSFFSSEYKNLSSLSLWEWEFYLGPVLLRDADQFSMAHSLEIREPLMDHEWVQFMLSLPDSVKYSSEKPKKLIIRAFEKELPPEVWNRKKMGFTFPMQEWMKNELRSHCEKNMNELDEKNIFEKGICIRLWHYFLKGHPLVPWTRIWHLVVLNEWLRRNKITS